MATIIEPAVVKKILSHLGVRTEPLPRPGRRAAVLTTVKAAMTGALRQIRERDDAAELRACGADPIHELGVVFGGKRAYVQAASAVKKPTPRRRSAAVERPTPRRRSAAKKKS